MSKNVFEGEIKLVSIKTLVPDPDQPRQDFDEESMDKLKDSIKDKGIMNPIVVETIAPDKYLIVDGERRYRTAIKLGIKEVSVNILKNKLDQYERNIIRFQLQETHKQWSPFEKAQAMADLKEFLGITTLELSKALAISLHTCQKYLTLLTFPIDARKTFIKEKMPIDFIRELSYTNNILPDEIKKKVPDFINKALEKYKKGYIRSHDLRGINKLIKYGSYAYVIKFFNQLTYTVTNAASDSGLITVNFIGSTHQSIKKLNLKLNVIIQNKIELNDEIKLQLNELKKTITKL